MKEKLLNDLECFNDPEFKFDSKYHKYTYYGDKFESVTRFIQQFHKPFDQEYWSKKKADEAGVPQDWILNEWKKLNDHANQVGTDTHQWIEDYFNQKWSQIPTNLDVIHRINKFNKVYATHLHKLEPLKFETRIFSKKWKIAGMIDSLFIYNNKLVILDWKTNKVWTDDTTQSGRFEKLLPPFNDFYKNHLNDYSLQISMYSLILREWGFNVAGGYLVHIGPGDEDAKLHRCVDMTEKLEKFLNKEVDL